MTGTARLAAVLVGLLVPAAAAAQDTLTLEQAIARAVAGNLALQGARAGVEVARAEARATRAELFPRVTVTESWQRADQPVFVFSSLLSARRFAADGFAIDALNSPNPTGFFRTTVGVEQVLFDGGRRRADASVAKLRGDIAEFEAEETSVNMVLNVTRTFGKLLAAEAARTAAEAGMKAAREDLARTERRRDAGVATEADVLSLRVHLAELRERVIQAGADTAVARAGLNLLMGEPVERPYRVMEPALVRTEPVLPAEVLIAEARDSRPLLRRADAATRLAERARRGVRAAIVPQVAAQAAIEVSGTEFDDRASAWLVGGELRWSFSTGGAELARAKAAAESLTRARTERDDAVARVQVEIVSARARLEAALAREAVGRAAVAQARESQRIIRDRFDAGLDGTDEVLRASAAVLDAEARRAASVADVLVARAELNRAVGRAQ